jgi:hypothetical protein
MPSDGDAGARRAAAILGLAALAETTHASLSEDYKKVDLKISFHHPFRAKKLLTIHAQVKHGPSYVYEQKHSGDFRFTVGSETLQALSGNGQSGIVVWVPPSPRHEVYWHAPNPRKITSSLSANRFPCSVYLSKEAIVRPTIRYDLARLCDYSGWQKSHSRLTVSDDFDSVLIDAKNKYRQLKSNCGGNRNEGEMASITNPLAGDVRISRLAWRNVTRISRTRSSRLLALRTTKFLNTLLREMPDRYICQPINQSSAKGKGRIKEERLLIMWYREALMIDGEWHSLMARIYERVEYPSNWENAAFGINDVSQEAVLVSWWCKVPKKIAK